jgi:tetratricopeptide (TPR) repeat protein/tRNA A-37 threonylcarbamoyl transferase component Bud32
MPADPNITALLRRYEELRNAGQPVTPAEVCRDCPEMAEQLQRHLEALAFLDSVLAEQTGQSSTVIAPDGLPAVEGTAGSPTGVAGQRYRALRFHARGGLGEVHVAQDCELRRQVALKRIQDRHADNEPLRRRFIREAELTARLEHPGVVPVYGLGLDGAGRPSYAMRFIEGEPLSKAIARFHHDEEKPGDEPGEQILALRELLSRFIAVCNTLAFAHDRGIVHRDLKPANIMLGKYGETFVVDWGLAKDVGDEERQQTGAQGSDASTLSASGPARPSGSEALTETGEVAGTPAYMSPEQAAARWQDVGVASDVYSLGAILYELLTGRAPLSAADAVEVIHRVQCGEFARPRQVRAAVPRALEAVCLKAMALKREDRYATALELKGDVEHWLADEPVRAYREPWTARTRRWVRRHRAAVATAAAAGLIALLLGGGGWLWYGARRADTERRMGRALDRAEELRDRATRVRAEDPAGAAAALAVWRQALAAAEQAEDIRAAGLAGQDASQRAGRLLVELRAAATQADKDTTLLTALDDARLARSVLQGGSFHTAASAARYAGAFDAYGLRVRLARPPKVAKALRQLPAAIRGALVAALDDWAWYEANPDLRRRLRQVADEADDDPWRHRFRQAGDHRDTLKQLAAEAHGQPLPAVSFSLLAHGLQRGGARAEAVALLREAQRRYPRDFWINYELGNAVLETQRRPPKALNEVVGFKREKFLWDGHQNNGKGLEEAIGCYRAATLLRPRSAPAHNNLALALWAKGDVPGAIAEFKRTLALAPKDANVLTNLGVAFFTQGRLAEAVAEHRKALALEPKLAVAHNSLGNALLAQGRVTDGIAELRKALNLDPKYALAHYNLGNALLGQGNGAGAISAYTKAIALDPKNAKTHYNLGSALLTQGDVHRAIAEFQQALALNPLLPEVHCNLGLALRQEGRLHESLAHYRQGHQLGMRQAGWRYASGRWLKQAERLADLDEHLPAFLHGERKPQNATEGLELVQVCRWKKLLAASVHFYGAAFAADPKLEAANRYDAACNGALAAAGKGKEAANLTAAQKYDLRRQALRWLQADLEGWAKQLAQPKPSSRAAVQRTLRHWQRDPDLAGVRDQAALARLSVAERETWDKLWSEVGALLAKAGWKK